MQKSIPFWVTAMMVTMVLLGSSNADARKKKRAFTDTDREIRAFTVPADLIEKLKELHPQLPRFSCTTSFLPKMMDGAKPDKAIQYEALRAKLARKLKKLNPKKDDRQILLKIPDACEETGKAQKRLGKIRFRLLAELETVLATFILVLEKHEIFSKAKKYRKLYKRYYPGRNLEEEFSKRYGMP